MNLSSHIVKKARGVLDALAAGKLEPWMVAHAREVAPAFVERRRGPAKVVVPGKDREARRAERRDRIAAIRAQVVAEAGDTCERPGCGGPGTDLHHCISGPQRRAKESRSTCLLLCRVDHRLAHAGDPDTLDALATYCESSGMHEAAAPLRRRLDKIHEAQARAEPRKAAR